MLVLISTFLVAVVAGVLIQTIKGYYDLRDRPLPRSGTSCPKPIDVILLAVLAIFVQALSPHKYVGWAVMVLYLISTIVLTNLGFEHNLYQYGSGPHVPLSDMNGQGHFWIGPTGSGSTGARSR